MSAHRPIKPVRKPRGDDESISPIARHVTHHLAKAERMSQEAKATAAADADLIADVSDDLPATTRPFQAEADRILNEHASTFDAPMHAVGVGVDEHGHLVNTAPLSPTLQIDQDRVKPAFRSNPPKLVE